MLVCPRCNLQRQSDPALRLDLCPRCQTVGKEIYLEAVREPVIPARRRYDLYGLLASARAQLELSRPRVGPPSQGGTAGPRQLEAVSDDPRSSISPVH
jgi:hypothetical protein